MKAFKAFISIQLSEMNGSLRVKAKLAFLILRKGQYGQNGQKID